MTGRHLDYKEHVVSTIVCSCGDVFRASGRPASVRRRQRAWQVQHEGCADVKRQGRKVFWLSFCDAARPEGQQFLGACIVEVTGEDADDAALGVMMLFPLAQPGSEWIAAAGHNASRLGCNPGGQMTAMEIEVDNPNLSRYTFGVLMDRASIEALDLIEDDDSVGPR